jgi:hypothetical protein
MGPYPMTLTKMADPTWNAYRGSIAGPHGLVGFIIGRPTDLWLEAAYQYGKMLPQLAMRFTYNRWR